MKLFVDDLRACPDGWQLARTNTEAIRLLAGGWVDEISLDHDICVTGPKNKNNKVIISTGFSLETFQPVAYYISLMQKKPEVYFHTANYEAGERMARIIGCPHVRRECEQPYKEDSYRGE